MTRNLLRAGALACALMTSTAFCTQPALAQTAFQYRSLDANGVDLTRGDSVVGFTEATIGSGAAALTLDRVRGGLRGSSRFDLIALRRTVNADNSLDISIERGAIGERFTGTAGALTPRNADGATLTGSGDSYTHVASDGTVTLFGTPGELVEGSISSSFCSVDQASETSCTLVPLSITSPDGRQVQLEYDVVAKRLTNTGWRGCRTASAMPSPSAMPATRRPGSRRAAGTTAPARACATRRLAIRWWAASAMRR